MSRLSIRQHGDLFLDAAGAEMRLRGVNLGGDSKVPWPNGGTHHPTDFADHRDVSFVGRPFPLEEADEHFGRIAHWGFNTLRLLTTWEAVEHCGPGRYDEAYLDHFAAIAARAGEHGLHLFVDFHQDVWSRMSGGDGAPGWTFEAVGLDFTKFDAADAAHVMQARYDYASPEKRQAAYSQMSWGSNYRLPANAIMWTLFWGGALFTPDFEIDGENVQDFLQGHYLGAMDAVAQRLAGMPHVLGFDSLNEPGTGWFGAELSHRQLAATPERPERPRVGPALSPLDGLAMARGLPVTVPVLTRDEGGMAVPTGECTFNPRGVSIWGEGAACPFEQAGAYRLTDGAMAPLDEEFFRFGRGRTLTLTRDAYSPFYHRVATTIRKHQPDWSLFAEMDVFAHIAGRNFPRDMPERSVNACHWYDLGLLYLKRFDPEDHKDIISGEAETSLQAIAARYRRQLGELASEAPNFTGGAPTLIGEFGTPYDLAEGAAFEAWDREGDAAFAAQAEALGLMYDAMDALGLHSTQWNYTPSNRNDLAVGDGWNQEDLSIFARDQQDDAIDPGAGGRAVTGFCRPYAQRVQGRSRGMTFDRASGVFRLDFDADPGIAGATEVYVPQIQYPDGFNARLEGVPAILDLDAGRQRVHVRALAAGSAWLILERASPG